MLHKIQVVPNSLAAEILFFDEIDLDVLPDIRIVPLFGGNGSGKSTLLKEIDNTLMRTAWDEEEHDEWEGLFTGKVKPRDKQVELLCDEEKTEFYSYVNSKVNFAVKRVGFDPFLMNAKCDAQSLSEGQSIIYSVEALLKGMLKSTKRRESFVEDGNHAIVLLDELDSGMSLDNIKLCMGLIKRVLRQKRNIQFIMSFNNPYVCYFFPQVVSMYDGKVHNISNFEEMLRELEVNRELLKKARYKKNGEFKIYG